MNGQKPVLVFGILLFPSCVFAHGEDVLLPLFIQLCSIFIFLIWLIIAKLRLRHKLILLASYFLSASAVFFFTSNLPYRQNKELVDMLWIISPALIAFLTFMFLRRRK
jgi:hypothetical protein